MNIFRAMAVKDVEDVTRAIPVIDFGPAFLGCVCPDDPPRYPSAVYRDLVLAFYNANYFHRKDFAGRPMS